MLTKLESLLPARAGPLSFMGLAPRLPDWWKPRGGCRKDCSSKFACALLGGGWGLKAGGCPRRPASSADNRQGSASGKRKAGYPGPPWRFPPVSYPRAGGLSTAQGSPCAGRRLPGLCQHTFRTAPVLKPTCTHVQVRRLAFFSFGPGAAQPLAALPLTDAAYPLRVRPVCLRPKCRRFCGGWPTTRACGRSLFVKNKKKMGGALSPATRHPPSDPDGFFHRSK